MARNPKSVVVAFRLSEACYEILQAELERQPAGSVNKASDLARKFVVDALAGHLTYADPKQREAVPDMAALLGSTVSAREWVRRHNTVSKFDPKSGPQPGLKPKRAHKPA